MRTTCCLAECTPPARMRVLVGVPVAGGPDHCPDVHAAPHDVEQPPPGLVTAGDADIVAGAPPSAATLLAAFPAPPGTMSVES